MDKEFDLGQYKLSEEYKKNTYKPKLKYFFEYLDLKFPHSKKFDNIYFELLDIDDLMESLEFFIEATSPAKQTADDYKRALRKFFEELRDEYGIKNDAFTDIVLSEKFEDAVKKRTQSLKQRSVKGQFTDEKLETLRDGVDEFLNTLNLDRLIEDEIQNYNGKSPYYNKFISALTIKLVMKFGLANKTIPRISVEDLDLDKGVLKVNGFDLHLDAALINFFRKYLAIRKQVTQMNSKDCDELFIRIDGNTIVINNGQADNNFLFCLMNELIKTSAGKQLSYTTIVDLVYKGADVDVLSKLVGVRPDTIRELCKKEDSELKEELELLFSGSKTIIEKKTIDKDYKGALKCTFCGKIHNTDSRNWILVQFGEESSKYLACKDCEGKSGRFKY